MPDFDADALANKIDWEGGITGGALGYYGEKGPEDAPEDIKTAWAAAWNACEELCKILEQHGALL